MSVTVVLGACATHGLRGNTYSSDGPDDPQYVSPWAYTELHEHGRYDWQRGRDTYEPPHRHLGHGSIRQHVGAPPPARSTAPHDHGPTRRPKYFGAQKPPVTHRPPTVSLPGVPLPSVRPEIERAPAAQPAASPKYRRTGWARWMGGSWKNHKTTSGEMFDPQRLTAAHESLPLPSFLYVTNRANGRTVLVRVNDRVPAQAGRIVIVSQLTAELLGFREAGRAQVDIQYAGAAAAEPNAKHEETFVKRQPWFHRGLLRGNRTAKAPDVAQETGTSNRYPAPTYPRWDNTRRP